MSLLEVNKFNSINNNIPNIYNLNNFDTIDDQIFVKIVVSNRKVISVLFDDIKLKFDDDYDDYQYQNIEIDMTHFLDYNNIFDMEKYKELYDVPLTVHFTLDPELYVYLDLREQRSRVEINNKTILNTIFLEELNIVILNKDYQENFNEYTLCMKISQCKNNIENGNMHISASNKIYFSSCDKYIDIFEINNDNKYCIVNYFIPLHYKISKTINIKKTNKIDIKRNKFHTNTETLLKKFNLNIYSEKNREIGELICELYTCEKSLYLYIIKCISNNNEIFNFHKECKICKIKQTLKNSNVFSLYDSVCRHTLEEYILFLENNFNIDKPIKIKTSDILDNIVEDTDVNYMFKLYGKHYQLLK